MKGFLQRMKQPAHKKMYNIISHQRNAEQNHNEIHDFTFTQITVIKKTVSSVGKGVEKLEYLITRKKVK